MTYEMIRGIAQNEAEKVRSIQPVLIAGTTDATPTNLFVIETQDYERGIITYTVNALKDDGIDGLTIRRVFAYKNDGTTLSLSGEVDILVDNDFTTADIAASVSSDTIEIKITGEAATNITWKGSYEQQNTIVEVLPP